MKRIEILLLSVLCMLTSCVHQFPDESTPAELDITLTFDTEMQYFRTVKFPEETVSGLEFTDDPDNKPSYFDYILPDWQTDAPRHRIRYVVQAHRILSSDRIATDYEDRVVLYDKDATQWDDYHFKMSLPEGKYEIRVWADYVDKESDDHLYYDPSDFSGIVLNHKNGHHGNTDFRDAYSGKSKVEVIRYGSEIEPVHTVVHMARPMGKYVFVTTDLSEFADKIVKSKSNEATLSSVPPTKSPEFNIEDYELTIRCSQWLPTSYSMVTDRANDSDVNVQFKSFLKAIDDTHAIMGFDYVLSNPLNASNPVTKVVLDLILQDKEGNVLASHAGVYVPLKRSKMTLIEGSFLIQESDGGVSIDPGFNGPDIVVPVY